jgi:hypothetical protein
MVSFGEREGKMRPFAQNCRSIRAGSHVIRTCRTALAAGLGFLMTAGALSASLPGPTPADAIDVVDAVIQGWRLKGHVVTIRGMVVCGNDQTCRFESPANLSAIIWIDLDGLPPPAARHLVLNCEQTPCAATVTGRLHNELIAASSIVFGTPPNEP